MSVLAQFWWNWAVQFFVALGTIGAVVVALLGDWLKAKLLRLDVAIENRPSQVPQTRGDQPAAVTAGTETVTVTAQPASCSRWVNEAWRTG